jgi:hypothetical protein
VVVSVEPDLASDADRSRAMATVREAFETMAPPQRSALEPESGSHEAPRGTPVIVGVGE